MLRAGCSGAALALFLEDLDPIVVHVLACSAGEVAEYLAVKASGQPFTARALATFRNNSWRDINKAQEFRDKRARTLMHGYPRV
jgi:NAD/NADP transhydrogenase beta subunit